MAMDLFEFRQGVNFKIFKKAPIAGLRVKYNYAS